MLIFDYRKSSFSIIDDNEEYFKLVDEWPYEKSLKRSYSKKSASNVTDSPLLKPLWNPEELPAPFELPPSVKFLEECGGSADLDLMVG